MDKFALFAVDADRFRPGTHDGSPVAVAQTVEVDLQACIEEKRDDVGKKTYWLRLLSQPVQTFGTILDPPEEAVLTSNEPFLSDSSSSAPRVGRVASGVSAPVLLKSVVPKFTEAARRAKFEGNCLISTVVDAHGMPQNIKIVRSLEYGLGEQAAEAVSRYRFKPAMKNGTPIPVMMYVQVDFHLVP